MTALSEWLSPAQVKQVTGYSLNTIWLALESGELHGHQAKPRGHWRIKAEAVEAWIKHRNGAAGEAACGCTRLAPVRRRAA